ncbi:MAG TPA: MarR family transcriptional regulator [Actinomycetota bacterium]|nr:MarR family transcriptional regulator [Actinomycetota bacterium]
MEGEAPSARRLIDRERRVHRILRAQFTDALLDLGTSFAQLEVMELLDQAIQLHPGEIGRRLDITRQSATHLVRQLERASLVETWQLERGSVGVRLTRTGRASVGRCLDALRPTFSLVEALEEERRRRLAMDLRAWENALRPRRRPWWVTAPM